MFVQIAPKRRGIVGGNAEIFVHVKADHLGPVDFGRFDKRLKELVLAGRGGENNARDAGELLAIDDRAATCSAAARPAATRSSNIFTRAASTDI